MLGRGTLTYAPQRRLRLLITLQTVWVVLVCLLGGWWGHLVLKQADRIAELERGLGVSASAVEIQWLRTQRMLYWESGTFLVFLIASLVLFFILYWRDLRRARSIQAFFASVTHELRTPLTSIRLQAEAIADRVTPEDPNAKLARRLIEDTSRLEAQVERTLELARMEGGGRIYSETIPLRGFFERFMGSFGSVYVNRLKVVNELGSEEVQADVGALQVVLRNLLDNSLKHAGLDESGVQSRAVTIRVKSEKHKERVILRYEDDGTPGQVPSMAPSRLGKLFEKGARSQGAGVGLYLIRTLMKRMKGDARFFAGPGFPVELEFQGAQAHVDY